MREDFQVRVDKIKEIESLIKSQSKENDPVVPEDNEVYLKGIELGVVSEKAKNKMKELGKIKVNLELLQDKSLTMKDLQENDDGDKYLG
mmetsp:Transcript_12268/g.12087  ORF Transcript_12268/g.12087 Transcript_12268/m.12087 type:complete len:89 (+) Transcript_12268:602-868(+)